MIKVPISLLLSLFLLLALFVGPQPTLLRSINAQERNINVNERLDFRALGIDNEVKQFVSLVDLQTKFFKRGSELRQKSVLSTLDRTSFLDEANKRKSDVSTIKNQLESLINKLKQKNLWNEAFDAQFLSSLKNDAERSLLRHWGGARKLFQDATNEVGDARADIEEEVREVNARQTGKLHSRSARVLAAHASPVFGKLCPLLATAILFSLNAANLSGQPPPCDLIKRYNDKGCVPKFSSSGC